jgi:hypothetical protein
LKGADYADSGSTKESKESHEKGILFILMNNTFVILS